MKASTSLKTALPIVALVLLTGCVTHPVARMSIGTLGVPDAAGTRLPLLSRVVPMVEGSMSSNETALFVLDTGASRSAISPDQATRWGVTTTALPDTRIFGASGETRANGYARLNRITFGSASVQEVDVLLLPQLQMMPGMPGIIGIPILSQAPVLLDGKRGEVRFLAVGTVESNLSALYPGAHWSRLPLRGSGAERWVEMMADKQSLRMFVDTGSAGSSLQPSAVRKLALVSVGKKKFRTADVSGDHLTEENVYRLGIRLGSWICELETTAHEDSHTKTDGTLGFDLLGQVPCVFDNPGQSLWVLDVPGGTDVVLHSTMKRRAAVYFEDPLPAFRRFFAISSAQTGNRQRLAQVAALLNDNASEVRDAAAMAIATLAEKPWPEASRIQEAKAWWESHQSDPEYQLPAKSQQ